MASPFHPPSVIVDLLDAYHITWKCYNLGLGTGSQPTAAEGYNALAYFQRWFLDPRLYYQEVDYYNELNAGTLPQVTFLITESLMSEHPPADIQMGQQKMQQVITALMQSRVWKHILTSRRSAFTSPTSGYELSVTVNACKEGPGKRSGATTGYGPMAMRSVSFVASSLRRACRTTRSDAYQHAP